jgi:phenylalanine-4-hydroxylase
MLEATLLECEQMGLTNDQAPFVKEAQRLGLYFIEQPYELYSEANHRAWRQLYASIERHWHKYAHEHYLEGLASLALNPHRVPRLEDVNRVTYPLTNFRAQAVSGYLPAAVFFDCLRHRQFPTTITIREADSHFSPWPDIFHDIVGHVPMYSHPALANTLARIGQAVHLAAEHMADIKDEAERTRRLVSVIRAFARFFWFTIECGLMRSRDGLKVYGGAFLSSHSEMVRCVESTDVQRYPLQLDWVINQGFLPNYYQPLLFIVESFDHLFELVEQMERLMLEGRLDNVAPGEPFISEEDLKRI